MPFLCGSAAYATACSEGTICSDCWMKWLLLAQWITVYPHLTTGLRFNGLLAKWKVVHDHYLSHASKSDYKKIPFVFTDASFFSFLKNNFTPSKTGMLVVRRELQGVKMREKTEYREVWAKDKRRIGFNEIQKGFWRCI